MAWKMDLATVEKMDEKRAAKTAASMDETMVLQTVASMVEMSVVVSEYVMAV